MIYVKILYTKYVLFCLQLPLSFSLSLSFAVALANKVARAHSHSHKQTHTQNTTAWPAYPCFLPSFSSASLFLVLQRVACVSLRYELELYLKNFRFTLNYKFKRELSSSLSLALPFSHSRKPRRSINTRNKIRKRTRRLERDDGAKKTGKLLLLSLLFLLLVCYARRF